VTRGRRESDRQTGRSGALCLYPSTLEYHIAISHSVVCVVATRRGGTPENVRTEKSTTRSTKDAIPSLSGELSLREAPLFSVDNNSTRAS
jgi:hypothetical protein